MAFAFAAAFSVAPGSPVSALFSGATSMTQVCRCSVGRRLVEKLGIDVGVRDRDPGLGGQAGLDHDVDEPLERQRTEAAPALLEELELAGDVRLA